LPRAVEHRNTPAGFKKNERERESLCVRK
jgi:hypothetical protein